MNGEKFLEAWESRYDESFAEGFQDRLGPDYYQMVSSLDLLAREHNGSAVRGFHFSLAETSTIHPSEGRLWLFPKKPSKYDMEEIAVLVATESGWTNRKETINPESPVRVFCYELHPSENTSQAQVKVKTNSNYASSGLEGIEVNADDSLDWQVTDSRVIVVSDRKPVLL